MKTLKTAPLLRTLELAGNGFAEQSMGLVSASPSVQRADRGGGGKGGSPPRAVEQSMRLLTNQKADAALIEAAAEDMVLWLDERVQRGVGDGVDLSTGDAVLGDGFYSTRWFFQWTEVAAREWTVEAELQALEPHAEVEGGSASSPGLLSVEC